MNRAASGVAALAAGAVLGAVGTALPLYGVVRPGGRTEVLVTAWHGLGSGSARLALPAVVGVGVLVVAVALSVLRPGVLGRFLAAVGAALSVGVAAVVATVVAGVLAADPSAYLGSGAVLLAVASVIALVGAALVQDWTRS
ncbi:hypothetical protein GCM10022243_18100 [Saccharothrix violaceirubra]|uniref:Putative membrane protein n=1 Tax=Saccharothrix violaceirubra TaxID=413306 RepID=A0A7W7WVC4_9PSEU|nr:hypothetical protein [Saccharothrix violaceirubra]MBB4964398.1 putative membrane protein [Saccharothrix violaceirubra]